VYDVLLISVGFRIILHLWFGEFLHVAGD